MKGKVVRLRTDDSALVDILNNLLELNIKDELTGLVIIASTKGEENRIHRYWFDSGENTCTQILGLIEYMKTYILDYMRDEAGEL